MPKDKKPWKIVSDGTVSGTFVYEDGKKLGLVTDLVIEAEHPRMVEVYAGLVKTLADVNKSLLELREKKMKIKGEDVEVATTKASPTNVTNNTIFVGSTEELMKAMKG